MDSFDLIRAALHRFSPDFKSGFDIFCANEASDAADVTDVTDVAELVGDILDRKKVKLFFRPPWKKSEYKRILEILFLQLKK